MAQVENRAKQRQEQEKLDKIARTNEEKNKKDGKDTISAIKKGLEAAGKNIGDAIEKNQKEALGKVGDSLKNFITVPLMTELGPLMEPLKAVSSGLMGLSTSFLSAFKQSKEDKKKEEKNETEEHIQKNTERSTDLLQTIANGITTLINYSSPDMSSAFSDLENRREQAGPVGTTVVAGGDNKKTNSLLSALLGMEMIQNMMRNPVAMWIGGIMSAIGTFFVAFGRQIGAAFTAFGRSFMRTGVGRFFGQILAGIGRIFAPIARILGGVVARVGVLRTGFAMLARVLGVLTGPIGWIITAVLTLVQIAWELGDPEQGFFGRLISGFRRMGEIIWNFVTSITSWLTNVLSPMFNWIGGIMGGVFGRIGGFIANIFNNFAEMGAALWQSITSMITGIGTWVIGFFSGIIGKIIEVGATIWQSITSMITGIVTWVIDFYAGIIGRIIEVGVGIFTGIAETLGGIVTNVRDAFIAGFENVVGFFRDLPEMAMNVLRNAPLIGRFFRNGPPSEDLTTVESVVAEDQERQISQNTPDEDGLFSGLFGAARRFVMGIGDGFEEGANFFSTQSRALFNSIVGMIRSPFEDGELFGHMLESGMQSIMQMFDPNNMITANNAATNPAFRAYAAANGIDLHSNGNSSRNSERLANAINDFNEMRRSTASSLAMVSQTNIRQGDNSTTLLDSARPEDPNRPPAF